MTAATTALILRINGEIDISFHADQAAAEKAASAVATYEDGWVVMAYEDMAEMVFGVLSQIYDQLTTDDPKQSFKPGKDLEKIRQECWSLLLAQMPGHSEYVEPDLQAEPESNEEQQNMTDEVAAPTAPRVARGKAAPAKAPAKAAAPKAPVAAKAAPKAAVAKAAAPRIPAKAAPKAAVAKAAPAPVAAKIAAKANGARAALAAAKPKPAGKAASNGDAAPRAARGELNPAWQAIFAAIAAQNETGMSVSEMATLCEQHGVGLYYRRFVTKGFLTPIARGVYALTNEGMAQVPA